MARCFANDLIKERVQDDGLMPKESVAQFSKRPVINTHGDLPFGEIPEPLKYVRPTRKCFQQIIALQMRPLFRMVFASLLNPSPARLLILVSTSALAPDMRTFPLPAARTCSSR